jgi:hypothetical protein
VQYYNLNRSPQRYQLNGRTPAQVLREALGVEDLQPFTPEEVTLAESVAPDRIPGGPGGG